jgi:hypothetical protein
MLQTTIKSTQDRSHVEARRNTAQCAATKQAMPQRFAPRYQCTPWAHRCSTVRQGERRTARSLLKGARALWVCAGSGQRRLHEWCTAERSCLDRAKAREPREKTTAHIAQRQSGQASLGAARAGSSGMGERAPRNLSLIFDGSASFSPPALRGPRIGLSRVSMGTSAPLLEPVAHALDCCERFQVMRASIPSPVPPTVHSDAATGVRDRMEAHPSSCAVFCSPAG